MDDIQVCPICGTTLYNCYHHVSEMIKFCKTNNELAIAEIDALDSELKALQAKLDELHIQFDTTIDFAKSLQAKLDEAKKAMNYAATCIKDDNIGYIDSVGAYQILLEALKKLEA